MQPRAVLAAGVLGAFGAAMTMPAFAETDYVAKYGIKEDIPGICSYASIDAKDYTGHEITILTHAVPVMGEPVALHSKQFEELTGRHGQRGARPLRRALPQGDDPLPDRPARL